ncbi:MAG: AsmA-like C-terminal region-containing protein [Elusimicrobiota bacterium]
MKIAGKIIYYIYYGLKFAFILLAFSAVFSYLAFYYVINHYFTRQEIKSMVTGQLQDFFARPTTIESVFFDAYGRLQIKGLKIYSKDNQKYFIVCPRITGKFSPYSVISGKLEINNIKLISPEFFLRRNQDGKWRFEDIIEKWKERKSKGSAKIDGITVEDGKVFIEDMKNSFNHNFEKIDFLADFSSDSAYSNFTVSTEFKSSYLKTKEKASFYLNADFIHGDSLSECSLENISVSLNLDGKIYSAKGNLKNLSVPQGSFSLELPATNLKDILPLKDEFYLPQNEIKLRIWSDENLKYLRFKAFLESIKASAEGFVGTESKNIEYNFSCGVKSLQAEKIKLTLSPYIKKPAGTMDLDMRFSGGKGEKKWNISADFYDSSFSDLEDIALFSKMRGKLILNESFKALNILKGEAKSGNNVFGNINFKWEQEGNIEKMSGRAFFNGKKTVLKGIIKNNESVKREGEFSVYSSKADINEISNFFKHISEIKKRNIKKKNSQKYDFIDKKLNIYFYSDSFYNEYGKADKVFLQAKFSKFYPDFMKISGDFSVKAEKGTFIDIQSNAEKNNIYHLISLPITTIYKLNRAGSFRLNSELKNIDFSQTAADYSLNNGKIVLNSFYIDGKDFMAYTKGEMDFKEETMNLSVYVLNNKFHAMGCLPEALTDAKGRPALAFKLKGKFKNNETKILDPNNNPEIIKKAIDAGINLEKDKFVNSEVKWQK